MARPERNNVDYFPFYCEDGNKMFYIEETYGNDGFATFIKLLRELAKTNYHYLDLSKQTTKMFLSAKCKVSNEVLLAIINDLVELGKFDRTLWKENSIIWCQDFVDSIQDAYKKRNNECITYWGLLQLLISLGIRKPMLTEEIETLNPQRKEKDSKENKKKVNNNEIFYSELLETKTWLDDLTSNNQNKFDLEQVKEKLLVFKNDINLKFDHKSNKKEFASHFVSWLNQQKNEKRKPFFDSPA